MIDLELWLYLSLLFFSVILGLWAWWDRREYRNGTPQPPGSMVWAHVDIMGSCPLCGEILVVGGSCGVCGYEGVDP